MHIGWEASPPTKFIPYDVGYGTDCGWIFGYDYDYGQGWNYGWMISILA